MKSSRVASVLGLVCLSLLFVRTAYGAEPEARKRTALDEYLAKPDPTYAWRLVKAIPGDGYTTFLLDLKSQTWRTTKDVDRTVWQHWLVITMPDSVKSDVAMLKI